MEHQARVSIDLTVKLCSKILKIILKLNINMFLLIFVVRKTYDQRSIRSLATCVSFNHNLSISSAFYGDSFTMNFIEFFFVRNIFLFQKKCFRISIVIFGVVKLRLELKTLELIDNFHSRSCGIDID